jgi:hypothetical protein
MQGYRPGYSVSSIDETSAKIIRAGGKANLYVDSLHEKTTCWTKLGRQRRQWERAIYPIALTAKGTISIFGPCMIWGVVKYPTRDLRRKQNYCPIHKYRRRILLFTRYIYLRSPLLRCWFKSLLFINQFNREIKSGCASDWTWRARLLFKSWSLTLL